MYIKHIIKKILFEDYKWSKEYQIFKKYENKPGIYVRFTSAPMIKKIFTGHMKKNLDISEHNDPAGIYAFPLQFVLDNYHNLVKNIFFSYTHISILEDRSKNKFIVSDPITYAEAVNLLNALFQMDIKKTLNHHITRKYIAMGTRIEETLSENEINMFFHKLLNESSEQIDNVVFFRLTKLNDDIFKNPRDGIKVLASEDRQRMRWIRAGYDAIEDKNNVIYPAGNEDEKEQIIFLTEDSFEILERIDKLNLYKTIRQTFDSDPGDIIQNQNRIPYFIRRAIAHIMQKTLNDKMVSISSNEEVIDQYAKLLKNYYKIEGKINEVNEESLYQGLVGLGLKYNVIIIAIKQYTKTKPVKDKFIFEVGIYNAKTDQLIHKFEIDSESIDTFDIFMQEIEKNINIKRNV